MKAIQRELADVLNECREEIQKETPRRPLSHGFRKNLSIITNAHGHTARRYVLNIDIADFFPTFNFGRVRGFFIKDRDFELHENVATVIAQIACFENSLPQGSPCSPVIADMIAHLLDVRLVGLAKSSHVTYSRYADDISFSTNRTVFPSDLAKQAPSMNGTWVAGDELEKQITRAGFVINSSKTRMQFRGSRQVVTGLTVNTKVNVSQRYWRGIRSMCHSLYMTGQYHLPEPKVGSSPAGSPETITRLDVLAGMLSHVHNVKRNSGHFPDEKHERFFGQADHTRFWFFRSFVALDRPLIVCEGPTDNIYLRNAIRQLSPTFPQLGVKTPEGFKFALSLFSYENQTHKILGITGGIGPLLKLIHSYRKLLGAYKFRPLEHPVIVLTDNDTALSGSVCNALKKHFGVNVTHASTEPFFHLAYNLYLVKVPLVTGKSMTCIEDLFDAAILGTPLDGKVFHIEEKDFDSTKHIGKKAFAKDIVAPNAAAIAWTGFAPLLERIVDVLKDYAVRRASAVVSAP